jgi:hypothetical protein
LKDTVTAVKLYFIIYFHFYFHFFNLFSFSLSLSLSFSPSLSRRPHSNLLTATKALCPTIRPHSDEGVVSTKASSRPALVQKGSDKALALRDKGTVSAKAPVRPALVQEGSAKARLCETKALCPPRLRSGHHYRKAHTHQEICRDLV